MSEDRKMHGVYVIRNYTVDRQVKSEWTKIGVAFPHKDGTGFNVKLTALPIGGELTIFPFREKEDAPVDQTQPAVEQAQSVQ
jgi:hypothetical protein